MRPRTGISVPLTPDEKRLLREDAARALRDQRDHARWLICQALGVIDDSNSGGKVVEAEPATASK